MSAVTGRVRALLLLGVVAIALALHPPPLARWLRELTAAHSEARPFDTAKNNRLADGLMGLLPVRQASLFSLDPGEGGPRRGERKPGRRYIQDYQVLEEAHLTSRETTRALVALCSSIRNSRGRAANCFEPRHALKLTTARGTVTLVVCFSCDQVYADAAFLPHKALLVSDPAAEVFDNLLAAHGSEKR